MREDKVNRNIGARIRLKRKEQGVNLVQLAAILDLSYQQLQKYESGASKITVDKLIYVAYALNSPLDYFLQDVDPRNQTFGFSIASTLIPQARTTPMQLLLIDSAPLDITAFQETATASGHVRRVQLLSSIDALLPYLQNQHHNPNHTLPDIIFLNIDNSSQEGLTALKRIKENQELRHIPVVILTANVHREDLLRAYKLGAASYILKSALTSTHTDKLKKIFDYWGNVVALQNM